MLKLDSVKVSYGAIEAVRDVSLEVPNGEVGTESGPVPLKYVVIWKKEGGSWKWHRDIWNLNS